jgi:nucleoside-diphosphate-sugar epimerase
MENILIIGSGYVGSAFASGLAAKNSNVKIIALSRSKKALPDKIIQIHTDVLSPKLETSVSSAIQPNEQLKIVYCVSADSHDEQAYRMAYVKGLANCIKALGSFNVARLVFVSSTGVYGQNNGEWVDETSETCPTSFSGKILLEAENLALSSQFNSSIIRLGGIYGPGRVHLLQMLNRGEIPHGNKNQYSNRIHRADCAGAISHILFLENTNNVYNGVDSEPASYAEIANWLGSGTQHIAANELKLSGKRVSNKKLLTSGYNFKYPSFREGYRSLM